METKTIEKNGKKRAAGALRLFVPEKALCRLYPGMPRSAKFCDVIEGEAALTPYALLKGTEEIGYEYRNLEEGLYHFAVSREGDTSLCQVVNVTKEALEEGILLRAELCPLGEGGYESGYVMLNTQAFYERQMLSEKNAWGEEIARLFATPRFTRERGSSGWHRQSTNEELSDFIHGLCKRCPRAYRFSLGSSPKYGFDLPLVIFTLEDLRGLTLKEAAEKLRKNGKLTVQYTAQVHSNEAVSSEGAMAMMLALEGNLGDEVLGRLDVYIVPRINPDGAVEVIRQSPTTGDDMNRDYLYLNNWETRSVVSAYNLFYPEIAIDGHEKRSDFLTAGESRCTDMEVQVGAGSLNHPARMTELAMEMAHVALSEGRKYGLRTHFYSNLASAAGGTAGSSYYGTRNSLSFLVETPGGPTLGSYFLERRVLAHYAMASAILRFSVENEDRVKKTVRESREEMIRRGAVYDEENLIVVEHQNAPTGSLSTPMIFVPDGTVTDPEREIAYQEQVIAARTRPRPTAYLVPKGLEKEERILRLVTDHALSYETLPAGVRLSLRQYYRKDGKTLLREEETVEFPSGALLFLNTVPSTVLGVLMEPDFSEHYKRKMTLFSMGLIFEDENGNLPVYRYCHDLIQGRIKPEE